jgi:extracellular elastinolytic metalloproteinase
MVQARDAIIDADVALTGGENRCEIWKGFAKRGLGAGAVTADPRVDNFDLPEGVC